MPRRVAQNIEPQSLGQIAQMIREVRAQQAAEARINPTLAVFEEDDEIRRQPPQAQSPSFQPGLSQFQTTTPATASGTTVSSGGSAFGGGSGPAAGSFRAAQSAGFESGYTAYNANAVGATTTSGTGAGAGAGAGAGGAGGAGGGAFSSAGSAGPVSLMILASALAQKFGSDRVNKKNPGSLQSKGAEALLPSAIAPVSEGRPLAAIFPQLGPFVSKKRSKDSKSDGAFLIDFFTKGKFPKIF